MDISEILSSILTSNIRGQRIWAILSKSLQARLNMIGSKLTEAAGKMGLDDFLPKDQWHLLKNTRQITSLNQAVCALCEDENNNLRFIHQSFKEFFLACYYASLSSEKLVNDKTFYHILKFNANFSIMYIERLLASTNSLAQKICNELLSLNNCTIDRISEYAKGNLRFLFIPSITFTIEEYLTVFPYGNFLYAGITFDRNVFSQLNNQGLIELKNFIVSIVFRKFNSCRSVAGS
ncbi:hypothetical protein D3Z51_16380 [Clostridiaceae bacterium]|nr:hypothetical protein [Clostridiaceae bacterium]